MKDSAMSANGTASKVVGDTFESMGAVLGLVTEIATPVFPMSSGSMSVWIVAVTVVVVSVVVVAAGEVIGWLEPRYSSAAGSGHCSIGRMGVWMVLSAAHQMVSVYWMLAVLLVLASVMAWLMSAIGASIG